MKSPALRIPLLWIIGIARLLVHCSALRAQALDQVATDAVSRLKTSRPVEHQNDELIIEVINLHSQRSEREARVIESSLFSAFQVQFPSVRIPLKGRGYRRHLFESGGDQNDLAGSGNPKPDRVDSNRAVERPDDRPG
jgi:hypothetical protein